MGCANSSPLANGTENIMETAKSAAQEMKHTGEEMMNDVNHTISGTVEYVKETVVGAVHGVGHDLESTIKGGNKDDKNGDDLTVEDLTESKYIPLKESSNGLMENLEERKTEMMKRVQSLSDEADKMADELIKETEDVIAGGVEVAASKVQNGVEDVKEAVEGVLNGEEGEEADKTPVHSIDSLKTGTPEPEIERILESNEENKSPSPKPTLMQLEDLEVEPSAPLNDTKLPERSSTNHHTEAARDTSNQPENTSKTTPSSRRELDKESQLTPWERLADAILRKPFPLSQSSQASKSASIDSLTTIEVQP